MPGLLHILTMLHCQDILKSVKKRKLSCIWQSWSLFLFLQNFFLQMADITTDPYPPLQRQKAQEIAQILDNLYPETPIPLQHEDTYTLLVAVVLSAQCTDVRVNQVTPKLFGKADNPFDMVKLDVREIEAIIRPCGLSPRKSQAIYDLSRILIEKHEGKVPMDWIALESLPGVGHKTASVVMSQGFGLPAFPVDTHIHRLAWRWGLSEGKNVEMTEKDLKALFPEDSWNKLHLRIIYFGREYCPARSHDPRKCPVCSKYGRKELFDNEKK
jgi:endonuclease-3